MNAMPNDWREARRLRAWDLKQSGWSQRDIADALGVTEGAVSQWMKAAREDGRDGLLSKPRPGPARKLALTELQRLPERLLEGAEAHGFRGALWTLPRIAVVIERIFGVRYHPSHVSKLLRQLGWSSQKPMRRARQRDEAGIAHWRRHRWPAIKRGRWRAARRSCS